MFSPPVVNIFTSVALSKLTYAAPSWHGFASQQDIDRVEAFIRRSKKWGLCSPSTPLFKSLCRDNDANLFSSILSCPSHTLYHLFDIKGACSYNLRPRAHPFVVPLLCSKLTESNFPIRILRKPHWSSLTSYFHNFAECGLQLLNWLEFETLKLLGTV